MPPPDTFLSGAELVDLYRNYYFCYDHDARDGSCSSYEEFEAVAGGFVLVTRHVVWDARTGAMAQALGYGYDVVVIDSVQRLSVEAGLLCASYPDSQAAVDRLSATMVRMDRTREPLISPALNWLKTYWRRGIREGSCSRYRWDYGALLKSSDTDGRWSWPARITLLRERPVLRVVG